MISEEIILLEKRKAGFNEFYQELIPALVDFIEKMGISPAHEVLKNAVYFVPHLDQALQRIAVTNKNDKVYLITRVGYFIGEYFVQKYSGCWYVNEIQGSRYFGRYVVGRFARLPNTLLMLDPFQIAQVFADTQTPRMLNKLLAEVDAELVRESQ